ncbi:hypothetical protein BK010_07400 [Tenericutes bacterium MO-XQ]|nr:hypothetical protein BK010_07400 [Tenericutes bacterium MO-XQ]
MAGKPKLGLEYFSVDVDMTRNMKIKRLMRAFGTEGYATFMFLVSWIYEKGQFWRYDNLDDVLFGLSEAIHVEEDKALSIINYLLDVGLLDKKSFDQGYLTSKAIQERYYYATKRRKVRILEECCLLSEEEMKHIDSKTDYQNNISVSKDVIHVSKDEVSVFKDRQSNSHNKSNSKKDKGMINHDIGSVDPNTIPFKINYYLQVLINNEIVSGTEDWITVLNDFLYMITKKHNKDDVRKAIFYSIKRIKFNQWKDEHGYEIANREPYLEETISNNIAYNESNIERIERMKNFNAYYHQKIF